MVSTSSTNDSDRHGSTNEPLLRIAIPNKGSLSASASEILREAGYRQRTTPRSSPCSTPPTASSSSTCARATSRCTSARAPSTSASPAATCCSTPAPRPRRCCRLGFGRSRFRFAARPGTLTSLDDLAGKRIATSYVGVVRRHLEERGIDAEVIRLDGAVETSIQLGVADVIADVVETGSTLKAAGLEIVGEVILESEAVLITRAGAAEPAGLRGVQAPPRRRARRADLRDDGLRHARGPARGRASR